jgi:hypothetical protein
MNPFLWLWSHIFEPAEWYEPTDENYVGHAQAIRAGRARCTCSEHGSFDIDNNRKTDIFCPFHGR